VELGLISVVTIPFVLNALALRTFETGAIVAVVLPMELVRVTEILINALTSLACSKYELDVAPEI
jgi:hypothetical protein